MWINDGSGNFSDSGQSLGSDDSRAVALGDLNGDGDLDAFVANTGQANRVWINDGNDHGDAPNTFGTRVSSDGARHLATGPRLGSSRDVDTDGQPTSGAAGAAGDDSAAVDDEDGVTFASTIDGEIFPPRSRSTRAALERVIAIQPTRNANPRLHEAARLVLARGAGDSRTVEVFGSPPERNIKACGILDRGDSYLQDLVDLLANVGSIL